MVKFLIHRPIAVLMTVLGILILGLYAFGLIPISLMPDIDIPEITIQVSPKNMSARQLEDVIIKPLRTNLMQISHLKDIRSEASNEQGIIYLSFTHGVNIDYSFIEVNEKIDRAMGSLPKNMVRPKVIKASAVDIPVFYLSITLKDNLKTRKFKKLSNSESFPISREFANLSRFTNQVIHKRIEQVDEVAMVDMSGLIFPEILIIPDYQKLYALDISLDELEKIIIKNDIEVGNLLIKDSQYQYNVRIGNSLKTIQEIENIYIHKNNRLFQLKELAQVLQHPQKRSGLVLSEGKEAITMAIIKQSDARMEDLKLSLNNLITQMEKDYPNINFSITRDQTKLLDFAINNLTRSLFWGIVLAFSIMFIFLKNIKSPLLIGITIPASIVTCLFFFYIFNISINIISLSGLVLSIGLMIDNSIIVIDNITQYRQQNYSLNEACIAGTNEVLKPLLSSALTTCAVFLPLVFLSGIAGALFYDQAMAITIGLFVSLLISISLLPVLYRLIHLNDRSKKNIITIFLEKTNTLNYSYLYGRGFRWVMKKQKISWILLSLLLIATVGLFKILEKKQMPNLSTAEFLLKIDWNEPINIKENKRRVLELLNPARDYALNHTALVGKQQFLLNKETNTLASESVIYVKCKSTKDLVKTQNLFSDLIEEKYSNALYKYKKVDNIFNLIFLENQAPLVARLRNIENLGNEQNEHIKKILHQLEQSLGGQKFEPIVWQDQINLIANQKKLLIYNISVNALFNALKRAFNEYEILSIIDNNNFVPIILGGVTKDINKVLNETTVESSDGTIFNVKDFIEVERFQDIKTITGSSEGEFYPLELFIPKNSLENTIKKVKSIVELNKMFDVNFSGSIFSNDKLVKEMMIVFLISLVLLYIILASQFESFVLPLIILLEIPIDLAGVFLFLKVFGMSINLMSMIGIVVMSGIIINDSILKIDTIIQLQKKGSPLMKALLVAGHRRFKPILMTSLTTILALLPLLFSSGIGAELQAPLAISLIGGMLLGTFVSLYFIPLCYYYLAKNKYYEKSYD